MDDDGYEGSGTIGGKLGCAISLLVGLPLLSVAVIYAAMGQCVPDAKCIDGWVLILIAFVIAAAAGVAGRAVINVLIRRFAKGH